MIPWRAKKLSVSISTPKNDPTIMMMAGPGRN
jgi:hypothetical protein